MISRVNEFSGNSKVRASFMEKMEYLMKHS